MTATAQAWLDNHVAPGWQAFIRVAMVAIGIAFWVVAWWPGALVFVALSALVLWA